MMREGMGQQKLLQDLIGMHSIMHLMHPNKVLQLLHAGQKGTQYGPTI